MLLWLPTAMGSKVTRQAGSDVTHGGSSDFGKLVATDTKVGATIVLDECYPTPYHSQRCGARCACIARAGVLHPSLLDGWGTVYTGRMGAVTDPIFVGNMHMAAAD